MPAQRSHQPQVFLSTSRCSFQVGASSQSFAVYAANRNLKIRGFASFYRQHLYSWVGNSGLHSHPLLTKCCIVVNDQVTMRKDIDTTMSRRHHKTQQDTTRREDATRCKYNNATTLLSMPMCTYIIEWFTILFELWAGAQTIWIGRRMVWFWPT